MGDSGSMVGLRRRGGELGRHQLGPDAVPVFGPQIAAGDGAGGGLLDVDAALDRYRPLTARPLADGGLPDADLFGQDSLAAEVLRRALDRVHALHHRQCRCNEQAHCLSLALPVAIW